jgi:dipeptidyl aminopeptidase/acylaminoacyl peptidase
MRRKWIYFSILFLFCSSLKLFAGVFEPNDVFQTTFARSAAISPDGKWIAYVVYKDRAATDKPGAGFNQLYLLSADKQTMKPFITGEVSVSSPRWGPDGKHLAFLMSRGDKAKTQVWTIAVDGGEATQATHSKSSVSFFRWHPDGKKIAYISVTPTSAFEKELKDKGYNFIYYEENLKHRNLYVQKLSENQPDAEQLTENVTIWDFEFSKDGEKIAATVSKKNLIDHRYMFRNIFILDLKSKSLTQLTKKDGKMGNYQFSPDGSQLAFTAALERKDHAVSQVYVIPTSGGSARNLTIQNFKGHVNWVSWLDTKTIMYRSGEGVWSTFSRISASGGKRQVLLHSKDTEMIYGTPSMSANVQHAAFTGTAPDTPSDVFYWKVGEQPKRLTTLNPWLSDRTLGKQEVISYQTRDGVTVEGLLIYPAEYKTGNKYPLIVYVHGGPESHYFQRWVTGYSTPGQVMAGKGYAVFYPNYRASTGYGIEFAAAGYDDPAGKEFDDVADGITHLINEGVADGDRVGLAGGSYGGYASGWFATYYTKMVKAVCMFVGISDLISKSGTTDIAYEDMYVHMGRPIEDRWDFALKRSPIYWAHQSQTATLIYGGAADTRVHPAQSMELYRRMKMHNHPAVRLVQYPGEGHGNRRQPGRIDVLFRQLEWFDWYVMEQKPLSGPMPRLDISDKYDLELKQKD